MKRKHYILGVLAMLCLLGTGYYAWTQYDAHRKQVAEWNEGAKAAFEEALWMEVNKRAEVPFYSYSSSEYGMTSLNERIPDSVSVVTMEGFRKYKIDRDRYENSLVKETVKRGHLGFLLEEYPLSVDTLSVRWNGLLPSKSFSGQTLIRYIYTDLNLDNDTVFSFAEKRLSRLDSLTVKYLGYRCEHELTAYVSYSHWMTSMTGGDGCILLFPWILLVLFLVYYPKLDALAKRKLIHKETVVVEKEVHVADVVMDKTDVIRLPDGTLLNPFSGSLNKDGLQQRLQPQSVSLLQLLLSKEGYQATSDEICIKLWGNAKYSYRLHSAVTRLRNDLKAVKSELIVSCSYSVYELKSPISSNISNQN